MGLLYEIASMFYGLDSIAVRVLESKNDNPGSTTGPLQLDPKTVTVKYRLDFDNRDYVSFMRGGKISELFTRFYLLFEDG